VGGHDIDGVFLLQLRGGQVVKKLGFTIVELLVVVVVIAILASITIVAFRGVQARARDTVRINDAKSIIKAVEAYKVLNGQYPAATPGCWETSTAASFMEYLNSSYGLAQAPLDPVNDATYYYAYCRYPASSSSCAASGYYAVVTIKNLENPTQVTPSNWQCGTRNWSPEFDWSWGSFE
jgi:prepilin-type N-terminal cleavage/methylation domain-containing protein